MLKTYFILYKPFLIFLASFFLTYIILTFLYQNYLNSFAENRADTITKIVSKNTEQVLLLFDQDASVKESATRQYYKIIYNNKYLARIVEGCNAMSVIILFISFVVAFAGKLVPTLLYILGGSVIIYVLNVMRIAALSVLIFYFPQCLSLLHGVLFPLYIYGVVFILWLIWVRKFSRYAAKDIK
jgi:exosortase family protein XrtF